MERGFGGESLTSDTYRELRGLAARQLARRPRSSLQPTELLHEALLRLRPAPWPSRRHFFGAAIRAIHNALVDHLRTRLRQKRGGQRTRVSLGGARLEAAGSAHDAATLHEALQHLADHDSRVAKVVVLRVVAGLSFDEVAETLRVSKATAERDFTYGRAWLFRELTVRPR